MARLAHMREALMYFALAVLNAMIFATGAVLYLPDRWYLSPVYAGCAIAWVWIARRERRRRREHRQARQGDRGTGYAPGGLAGVAPYAFTYFPIRITGADPRPDPPLAEPRLIGGRAGPVVGVRCWLPTDRPMIIKTATQELRDLSVAEIEYLRRDEGTKLVSMNGETVWPTDGWLQAKCGPFTGVAHPGEGSPGIACYCGIYAFADIEKMTGAKFYNFDGELGFVGLVLGVGRIIVHEYGWRAERARPLALLEPPDRRSRQAVAGRAAAYGIPIASRAQALALAKEWDV